MFKEYYRAVRFLESLNNLKSPEKLPADFHLKRAWRLIKELKINLRQFKFVHIAGTSGKGSVTAMVHNILKEAGKKVGSLYSPHTTTMIERIEVGDKYISPKELVKILNRLKKAAERIYKKDTSLRPGFQEFMLAMALLYFQKNHCEYAVLETSVGGEFDATNIIPQPIIGAITNIGLDHTHLLGETLAEIAKSKAGIIKPGVLIVTTETKPKILKILTAKAKKMNSTLITVNSNGSFDLSINGNKQNRNAELAEKIGEILGLDPKAIEKGIKKTTLPCRLEIIQKKPTVILDGAHNLDKIKSTCESLKKFTYKKLLLIIAVNENKDIKKIIKTVAGAADRVFVTRHYNAGRACADLQLMYTLFLAANKKIKAEIRLDPWQALEQALCEAKKEDLVLVTGSFFLAGELRKKWCSEERILRYNS
ncbi:hypothetical protein A3H03_03380 [Candidatus Kuenenbacteria bacterium RIFCSPLOWO2_12_FULL_42_13]|uniref:tetrahydrofolate synthase n=1 Tax=Candidatus Kuenenbacteria bacterium RIFCSPLOWO2_12_FULL_42_13 TaxID=1798565 RepID=A0A1F6G2T4_9BACT|nr:MAG: hypothetical protein A3H03_03380 [Candidatus Kuenenbacteria bacterium RIFCSPLOWO2_12_FULL_42_13]